MFVTFRKAIKQSFIVVAVIGRFQKNNILGLQEHISEKAMKMSAPYTMLQGPLFFQLWYTVCFLLDEGGKLFFVFVLHTQLCVDSSMLRTGREYPGGPQRYVI